ncbi:hypothetical protein VTI28DRAFT_265 [Corynascus sepedonium]
MKEIIRMSDGVRHGQGPQVVPHQRRRGCSAGARQGRCGLDRDSSITNNYCTLKKRAKIAILARRLSGACLGGVRIAKEAQLAKRGAKEPRKNPTVGPIMSQQHGKEGKGSTQVSSSVFGEESAIAQSLPCLQSTAPHHSNF